MTLWDIAVSNEDSPADDAFSGIPGWFGQAAYGHDVDTFTFVEVKDGPSDAVPIEMVTTTAGVYLGVMVVYSAEPVGETSEVCSTGADADCELQILQYVDRSLCCCVDRRCSSGRRSPRAT